LKFLHQNYENSWKLSLLIIRGFYIDYVGLARLRLNLPEVSLNWNEFDTPGLKKAYSHKKGRSDFLQVTLTVLHSVNLGLGGFKCLLATGAASDDYSRW